MSNTQTVTELNKFIKKFNLDLKKFLPKNTNTLNKSINYSILAGGKRFRPFLIYTFANALKVSSNNSIKMGIAVEMLHNYSLVHDDLPAMDNDKYRRGKKTTHFKYNEYTAILAGCGLLTLSYKMLSSSHVKLDSHTKAKLILALTEISGEGGLLQGQFEDLSNKKNTFNGRIHINKLKTGKLMSYCTEAVGIAAKISKKKLNLLKIIGMNIGEIFQISDDFNDEPKMSAKEKKYLVGYRDRLHTKTLKLIKEANIKNLSVDSLIDYLMDLKV
jgi:geranylgeranyl pyrophosphate synthase